MLRFTPAFALLFLLFCAPAQAFESGAITLKTVQADHRLKVQFATSRRERMQGLMHRETLAPYDGMLFDFKRPQFISMWMKNTPLPLDMVFFDDERQVVHIHRDAVPYSETLIGTPTPARYVLEVKAGDAARHGLAVGDSFRLEEDQ